jgi:hypothetical protein
MKLTILLPFGERWRNNVKFQGTENGLEGKRGRRDQGSINSTRATMPDPDGVVACPRRRGDALPDASIEGKQILYPFTF